MSQQPLRIALVNDYRIVVAGLSKMLRPFTERVLVVELDVGVCPDQQVDVALYDTFAAVGGDSHYLEKIVASEQATRVAVFSFSEAQAAIDEAFRLGADGYISKDGTPEELVGVLERIAAGEQVVALSTSSRRDSEKTPIGHDARPGPGEVLGLTPRQSEILVLIADGLSNEEIAQACYLSINTVKSYIRAVYRKIGVSTRAQAVAWVLRNGFHPDYPAM